MAKPGNKPGLVKRSGVLKKMPKTPGQPMMLPRVNKRPKATKAVPMPVGKPARRFVRQPKAKVK